MKGTHRDVEIFHRWCKRSGSTGEPGVDEKPDTRKLASCKEVHHRGEKAFGVIATESTRTGQRGDYLCNERCQKDRTLGKALRSEEDTTGDNLIGEHYYQDRT